MYQELPSRVLFKPNLLLIAFQIASELHDHIAGGFLEAG